MYLLKPTKTKPDLTTKKGNIMTKAVCVQKSPYAVELEAGDHYWCACGLSKKQPFCDGSHIGSSFTPVKFTLDKKETKYLCGCKATKTAPFCDGTHNKL
jgi:CDGSH-type Zn-finger protein